MQTSLLPCWNRYPVLSFIVPSSLAEGHGVTGLVNFFAEAAQPEDLERCKRLQAPLYSGNFASLYFVPLSPICRRGCCSVFERCLAQQTAKANVRGTGGGG